MAPLDGKSAYPGCNPHDGGAGGFASQRQMWFALKCFFSILFKPS